MEVPRFMDYLFPNFLSDSQEYQEAERLWQSRWDDLLHHLGVSALWESPWLSTAFGDGAPMRDGNPIFSAVSTKRRQGVRVIQLEPAENPKEITLWIDKFAKGEPEEITELVIACVLTPESILYAIDAMEQWVMRREVRLQRRHDSIIFPRFHSTPQFYVPGIAG